MQHSSNPIVIVALKGRSRSFSPRHMELIAACRRGNRKAQFEIYQLYYVAMYNTSLRIVGDPDDAEDVMQEAFLKAFEKLNSYKGEVSFGAWLKRIVINKSLDFLRMKKETIPLDQAGGMEYEDEENKPEAIWDGMAEESMVQKIRDAVYSLPEGYRIVLSLILLEGYDHEEVSQILGISNATSRTQYHRAKKKLIELLKE